MDSLFQRSLDDLIKGLRLHNTGSATFISKSLDEIRREIKSTDTSTKTTALQKLTYLHSLHSIDISWAAFHCIELSSSPNFHSKRIAYLAASLSFNPSTTEVILLLTHQLRKDLSSTNPHEASLALQTLSAICTPDLARDLTPELFTLLGTSRIVIKKKAIAAVLRVFELYPDAVRVCFRRLVENLENSDVGVVSAVLGVFCELASKDPKSYLPLAPEFFKILVDSRNNWVLIKVLKIFSKLTPLEPRLGKRVLEPICDHLKRTGAKSLAFECVRTIVNGLSEYDSAVNLAVEKIQEFLNEDDPNLKYLGLQVLADVAQKHVWAVSKNKEVVIKSLSDEDENVKLAALKLVMGMVSEDNLAEICRVLINYALKSDPYFCNEVLGSLLSTCSKNYYDILIDFDWYVSLLGEMSRIPHCQRGKEIENQLVDIGMRVKDARPGLVRVARELLIDPALLGNPYIHNILTAAAWVSGEYVEFSRNPLELMESLLQPRTTLLPSSIRAIYINAAFKVLAFSLHSYFLRKEVVDLSIKDTTPNREFPESSDSATGVAAVETGSEDVPLVNDMDMINGLEWSSVSQKLETFNQGLLARLMNIVETNLIHLSDSHEVELQERAKNVFNLIEITRQETSGLVTNDQRASEVIKLLNEAFFDENGPVSVSAQERVCIPDGLDLKENLNDLETICTDLRMPTSLSFSLVKKPHSMENNGISVLDNKIEEGFVTTSESTSLLAEHRKRHGLYYLPKEEKENLANDYPLANDLTVQDNQAENLFKLTEQSLVSKKKTGHTKPRPVVVKLDEVERTHPIAKKSEKEVDLISGAVRDILLGNEAIASSSRAPVSSTHSNSTSPRRNKQHHSHGKEKKKRSSRKGTAEHGKLKSRQRADVSLNLPAQSSVVPDFLL